MDQRLLIFVTAARRLNFSRAAEELYLSQPAISQQISSLEHSLGIQLFERQAKQVRLTKAGEIVLHHGQDILLRYSEMERLVHNLLHEAQGPLTIGASYTYGEYILPHVIAPFLARYPGITPVIAIDNSRIVEEQVAAGRLDIGIIEGVSTLASIQSEDFADDLMVIIASPTHPLHAQAEITVDDLSAATWIVRECGSGTRAMTSTFWTRYGITPQHVMEFSSTQVIKEAVEAGLGLSLLSEWTLRKERKLGTLALLPIEFGKLTRKFSLVRRKSDFTTKVVDLFVEHLRHHGLPM